MAHVPVIAISSGEPAGIGPDLCLRLRANRNFHLVIIADPELLAQRAQCIGISYDFPEWRPELGGDADAPAISVLSVKLRTAVTAGELNTGNVDYVMQMLDTAINGCLQNRFDAMVTGPIHKGIINDAGTAFTGHTEYLAKSCNQSHVVMMLATNQLRVALATTHLPLAEVCKNITAESLERTLYITHNHLKTYFAIANPRIMVCGLNPHAGESGHMGREEIEVIQPVIDKLSEQGLNISGPVPADTAFTPASLKHADVVLAMYHDQGLPVLKHAGFGQAVNITMGLPFVRTSVDHGTALDKAGIGQLDTGSIEQAINMAAAMVTR